MIKVILLNLLLSNHNTETAIGAAEKLFVFYPSTARSIVIQKKLSDTFSDFEITVFGRYQDFIAQIQSKSPDAILLKTPLIEQLNNYDVKLKALINNETTENYVLLSVDSPVNPDEISQMTLGTFDFLGKEGTETFVASFFTSPPKIKRVKKMEDLLPLITFKMVDAILIPRHIVPYFTGISNLDFQITELANARAGIAAIAVKNNSPAVLILKSFLNQPGVLKEIFGIEGWK